MCTSTSTVDDMFSCYLDGSEPVHGFVAAGPFGQIFRPDNFVFGQMVLE